MEMLMYEDVDVRALKFDRFILYYQEKVSLHDVKDYILQCLRSYQTSCTAKYIDVKNMKIKVLYSSDVGMLNMLNNIISIIAKTASREQAKNQ